MTKIAILIGTRPGIIKMTPLVHACERRTIDHLVIHTGQHYSASMDSAIMEGAGLKKVDYKINRPENCITHAQQTAYMLTSIEEVLMKEKPDVLLVCGDANTNLAGALAARKLHVEVGHVEAGLRSFDWRMPEEHNRVMIDHISEYLFAPTELSRKYLEQDGVKGKVFVVGNTIVDATLNNSKDFPEALLRQFRQDTNDEAYLLLTSHREENVDNKAILQHILKAVKAISLQTPHRILFPMHPRTKKRIHEFGFEELLDVEKLNVIEPLSYKEFLLYLKNAALVMTDSGGIQEESCILGTPCITLRDNTERPETLEVGSNLIAGTTTESILAAFKSYEEGYFDKPWKNPFGAGNSAELIIDACLVK